MNNAYYEMLAQLQQQTMAVIRSNIRNNALQGSNESTLCSDQADLGLMAKRTSTLKLKKRPCF